MHIRFGERDVVRNISFTLRAGETLGIVGESGSGKTVTVLSLLRLLPPSARYIDGKVEFHQGESFSNLLSAPEHALQRIRGAKISVIFQEPMSSLNPLMRCGQQIEEVFKVHRLHSPKRYREEAMRWIAKVGLDDAERIYKSYPHQLSGGQLQRVLIAIALCARPQVVIADEPTTALDVSMQNKILGLLNELKNEMQLSMIFISHDLGVIKAVCDRVLVMREGMIVEQGDIARIFKNPTNEYTKGLIMCRPPLDKKWRRLPTVSDFMVKKLDLSHFSDDARVLHPVDQDRRLVELGSKPVLLQVEALQVKYALKRNWLGRVTQYRQALFPCSFTIRKSEVLGLVGESGSGKSSLGKAILNLIPHQADVMKFGSINLLELDREGWRQMRKSMQMIFQDPYSTLNPRQRIGDTIAEPMEAHNIFTSRKERYDRAAELLEWVGMSPDHMKRYPHQFSGGQRQRIGIARALSLNPSFIVCDESVSALDVSVQAQILNLLLDLKDKLKLSYLFISHDLSVVNFIADRVMVLNQGRIEEVAKPYELLQNPSSEYTRQLIQAIPK